MIGFLIVRLKHLDYSIDSRILCTCICSISSDQIFAFCADARFLSQGREPKVEGLGSFSYEITASKSVLSEQVSSAKWHAFTLPFLATGICYIFMLISFLHEAGTRQKDEGNTRQSSCECEHMVALWYLLNRVLCVTT